MTLISGSESQTVKLASALAAQCRNGDCVLLKGELGSGKTAFARGFIRALCGEGEEVTSPTFTLMQNYQTRGGAPVWHFDLYRIKHPEELGQLGMEDAFSDGITLIEWPEIAAGRVPKQALTIEIKHAGDTARAFTFNGDPSTWASRVEDMR